MLQTLQVLPESLNERTDDELRSEIAALKRDLAGKVTILGHHYQVEDIIQFSDFRGDSLALAHHAAKSESSVIVFCGVHFMAETADILTGSHQQVILPDINAGCSMADMAPSADVESMWLQMSEFLNMDSVIPVTYINSEAALKDFVGRRNGIICTSSNAKKVITHALELGEKLFFFPDQHLGRNTCFQLGIDLEDMVVVDPKRPLGGLTPEALRRAKVLLWKGHCSVHARFSEADVARLRREDPEIRIISHPECSFEVCQASDFVGSTAQILETIRQSPEGSRWAVGTEVNLVHRIAQEQAQRGVHVQSLSQFQCLCATMYRIRLPYLHWVLSGVAEGQIINQVKVSESVAAGARLALDRMFALGQDSQSAAAID